MAMANMNLIGVFRGGGGGYSPHLMVGGVA